MANTAKGRWLVMQNSLDSLVLLLPDVVSLLDSIDLHNNEIQSYLDQINTDIDSCLVSTGADELRVTTIP